MMNSPDIRMEWGAFGARDVKPEFAWAVSRAKTAERVFEPCEKTQSAEKSFYVKVISFSYFFPFCFCAHHHSPSRHSFMPLPFIYNPLCALMARKKGTSSVIFLVNERQRRRKEKFFYVTRKWFFIIVLVLIIEWNIFVTIAVCFLCYGYMNNTSSWDPWEQNARFVPSIHFSSNLISCRKILFMLLVIFWGWLNFHHNLGIIP